MRNAAVDDDGHEELHAAARAASISAVVPVSPSKAGKTRCACRL